MLPGERAVFDRHDATLQCTADKEPVLRETEGKEVDDGKSHYLDRGNLIR